MSASRSEVLRLQPSTRAPATARDGVRRFVQREMPNVLDDAVLLVSELVTNAIAHGSGMVTLAVETDGATLGVCVSDEEAQQHPRLRDLDPQTTDGRGMWLVEAIAGAWGCRTSERGQGKAVWFRLP